MKPRLDGTTLEESLEAYIASVVDTGARCRVELGVFSGRDEDWSKGADCIFVRLELTRVMDAAGASHETWARLVGGSSHWEIPRVETEMLVVLPEGADGVGVGWAFQHASRPPASLSRDVAVIDHGADTELHVEAKSVQFLGGTQPVARKDDTVAMGTLAAAAPAGGGPVTFSFVDRNGVTHAGTIVDLVDGKITIGNPDVTA